MNLLSLDKCMHVNTRVYSFEGAWCQWLSISNVAFARRWHAYAQCGVCAHFCSVISSRCGPLRDKDKGPFQLGMRSIGI